MKKIMFNDKYNLTELVLSGHKTMTRRITKKSQCLDDLVSCGHDKFEIIGNRLRGYKDDLYVELRLPYYIGEVIAVAQNYNDAEIQFVPNEPISLKRWGSPKVMPGWNNKMFVRANLMPNRIRITNMKVERLQDISDEDCIKEGITPANTWESHDLDGNKVIRESYQVGNKVLQTPREAFAELIDRISGKGIWERNPYVWVYEFELLEYGG